MGFRDWSRQGSFERRKTDPRKYIRRSLLLQQVAINQECKGTPKSTRNHHKGRRTEKGTQKIDPASAEAPCPVTPYFAKGGDFGKPLLVLRKGSIQTQVCQRSGERGLDPRGRSRGELSARTKEEAKEEGILYLGYLNLDPNVQPRPAQRAPTSLCSSLRRASLRRD